MSSFKEYQSKPIKRLAYRIREDDAGRITKVGEATYQLHVDGKPVDFQAYEPVNPGDYIVYLNDSDIYHCNAKVFAERNVTDD